MAGGIRIESASIRILRTEFGEFPDILPLNPELRPGASSLRILLEVEWSPPDAAPLLRHYQKQLSRFLPEFARHRCRGPAGYHIAAVGESGGAADEGRGIEPSLALVHLAEHLVIDVVAFVTDLDSVSGVTAALSASDSVFDMFVECPARALAPLAIYQAFTWLTILLQDDPLEEAERTMLPLGRALYRSGTRAAEARTLATAAGVSEEASNEALRRLEYLGVACRARAQAREAPRYLFCREAAG